MESETVTEGYVSIQEAARLLETTPTRILMLLKEKGLEGVLSGDEWLVSRDSIACCKTHGRDMKTEQGCRTYCSSGGCGCSK
jgi:excisionase family DNA binding protein